MCYCDVMVNACWSAPDLWLHEVGKKWSVSCGEIVPMDAEPSDVWLWRWIGGVCVCLCYQEKGSVWKSVASIGWWLQRGNAVQIVYAHARMLLCDIYSVSLCMCTCGFLHVWGCKKNRQLIGCQSQVLQLSQRCCWWGMALTFSSDKGARQHN